MHAKLVLIASLVLLAASAVFGVGVFNSLGGSGFDDPASASSQASALMNSHFGGAPDLILLVHARAGTVDTPAAATAGTSLARQLAADPRLSRVTSYWDSHAPGLRSRDGSDALIVGRVVGTEKQAATNATFLLDAYRQFSSPAITVQIGGTQGADVAGQVAKDIALAEGIAIPLTLIFLLFAFGSVVAALLPFAVALLAIFGTFAELSLLTHVTDVSVFAINLTTALGLGLGVDYALLMVSRFREELGKGLDIPQAVVRTTATAGRTIAFSAATVAAALAAMLVFPVYFLKSFAYAGVAVTLFAAIGALLVLPALFAVLGHRINAGAIPRIQAVRSVESAAWGRLAAVVMRRATRSALPVVLLLAVLAIPLLHVTFSTPDDRVLPASSPAHQVGDALRSDFATAPAAIDVLVVGSKDALSIAAYSRRLSDLPGAQRVDSAVGSFAAGHTVASAGLVATDFTAPGVQRISVSSALDSTSVAAQNLVRDLRAEPGPPGATVRVGGATAQLIDAKFAIGSHLAEAAAIILVTTFILLFLFTGSIVQPIRALLGNALTLGATLGAMVWIFQDGHLAHTLKFTPSPTNTAMPVLLFCIAFGLSMDYEVFLLSRIKELHDAGSTTQEAVAHGLARTGRLVSTAAVLLAVSFFAFGASHVSFIQFFGLGTGLAILLDATLVRGVLVPASMAWLGEKSWWAPTPLRRLHQRIGLTEETAEAEAPSLKRVASSGTDC